MPVRNIEHEKLCDALLFAFGSQRTIRAWGRDVGFDSVNKIKYGINGECDIQGIVAPYGIHLGIEVKTRKAVLSKDQKIWRNMIISFGGIYIEARSVEEAVIDFKIQFSRWKEQALVNLSRGV